MDDLGGKGALFLLTRFINLFYLLKIIMGIRSPHMLEEVVGLRRIVSLLLPWVAVVVALLVDLQVDLQVAVVGVTMAVTKTRRRRRDCRCSRICSRIAHESTKSII